MGSVETHKAGLLAESWAAWFLRLQGWRVLGKRFKTPVGEIDIIMKRGNIVAFIEVKRRATTDDASYAISFENASRVRRAAEWWLKTRPQFADNKTLRFDVVAIAPYARIRHIPNAF